tara:strand:- start:350 stop:619 length:270 start_codon:yes stop_codon:yes gene_type:complete
MITITSLVTAVLLIAIGSLIVIKYFNLKDKYKEFKDMKQDIERLNDTVLPEWYENRDKERKKLNKKYGHDYELLNDHLWKGKYTSKPWY